MKRLVLLLALAACGNDVGFAEVPGPLDRYTAEASRQYPTIHALYTGEQGLYRGCGPNGGVCHNSNEYPVLDSMGGILGTIGAGCNMKRAPAATDDLCEGTGDLVTISGQDRELGWIGRDPRDPMGQRWKLTIREPVGAVDPFDLMPVRRGGATIWHLGYYASVSVDAVDETALYLQPYDDLSAAYLATVIFKDAGRPGDPLQLGDPNGNGVFGAMLGGRLVKPGDPAGSYLMRRLVDPTAGPLMPRANCCAWSKPAVRAMWCWIDGLAADGSNALAPIDYARCRPSPDVELLYPELGPTCEASGRCPPTAVVDTSGTDFSSIYRTILVPRCAGSGCHDRDSAAELDFSTEARAYATLVPSRVVAGEPDRSTLWNRIEPSRCQAPCRTMPLRRPALPEAERDAVRMWIEAGAEP